MLLSNYESASNTNHVVSACLFIELLYLDFP